MIKEIATYTNKSILKQKVKNITLFNYNPFNSSGNRTN